MHAAGGSCQIPHVGPPMHARTRRGLAPALLLQELVRKWQSDIRSQQRVLERQIRDIERDRKAAEKQVREAAKRGDMRSAKMLAKEIVHTKKASTACRASKLPRPPHLHSIAAARLRRRPGTCISWTLPRQ